MERGGRLKDLYWVGTAKRDVHRFPEPVRHVVGYALYLARCGSKAANAKPLKGFSGATVLEVIADHAGDTYRAVYTVKMTDEDDRRGVRAPRLSKEIEAGQRYAKARYELDTRAVEPGQGPSRGIDNSKKGRDR